MDTLRTHKMRSGSPFLRGAGVSVIMLVAALITGFDETIQDNSSSSARIPDLFQVGPGLSWGQYSAGERPAQTIDAGRFAGFDAGCPAVKNVTNIFADWMDAAAHRAHEVRRSRAIDFAVYKQFRQVYANAATLSGRSSAKATICIARKW